MSASSVDGELGRGGGAEFDAAALMAEVKALRDAVDKAGLAAALGVVASPGIENNPGGSGLLQGGSGGLSSLLGAKKADVTTVKAPHKTDVEKGVYTCMYMCCCCCSKMLLLF